MKELFGIKSPLTIQEQTTVTEHLFISALLIIVPMYTSMAESWACTKVASHLSTSKYRQVF